MWIYKYKYIGSIFMYVKYEKLLCYSYKTKLKYWKYYISIIIVIFYKWDVIKYLIKIIS